MRRQRQEKESHRLDQRQRADGDAAGEREVQGDHAAIGMADHVDTVWRVRQQRLHQPEFVVHPEAMTVRPGIGSAIANEIRSDHAEPGLQRVDHGDPHDRRAGGAVQQQHGCTRSGRQAGATQDWTAGSHVHFHAEFMPGEGRLPIDRISSRSVESHGSRPVFCRRRLRTIFNASFETNLLLRLPSARLRSRYAVFNPVVTFR